MGKLSFLLVLLMGTNAWADHHEGEETSQMVLPHGAINVQLQVNMNMSKDSAFDPVSIAPDLWYGVNDKITVGLVHTSLARTGFLGGVGGSLCVAGDGCGDVFSNTGVNMRYSLATGDLALAADVALLTQNFDPFQLGSKLGVIGQWKSGDLSVLFNPNLYVGFTERDAGNKESLNVPVSVMYGVNEKANLGLQVGLAMPFDNAGDLWSLPVSLGGQYAVTQELNVLLAFSLPFVAGGDAIPDGFDVRTLTLGVGYNH